MPSLDEVLKKNVAKTKFVRNPLSIATEDRPYSITDSESFQPIFNQTSSQPKSLFNTEVEETENSSVTFSSAQNVLRNHENIVKENGSKVDTNPTQTKHKVDTNPTRKLNTNLTQSEHTIIIESSNLTQTQHKPNTKLNTQSRHKLNTNLTQATHISALIGVQRKMLLFLFDECKKACSRITEPLSIIHISQAMEIPTGSIKTSIARLCEKKFIKISGFKNGRGGWSSYEIPDAVYKELLQMETQHKLHTNHTQTTHKVDTQPNTNVSSSSLKIKETTTTTTQLDNEWDFDITPYAKFGFMTSQLKQLTSLGVISAIEVEQSLIEFNHDLDNNALPQMNKGKLNFLMGILRKGQSYVSESYRNEEETIISEMARRAEGRRKKLLEDKFMAWEASLGDKERKKIEDKIPLSLKVMFHAHGVGSLEVKTWLFNYYLQTCFA